MPWTEDFAGTGCLADSSAPGMSIPGVVFAFIYRQPPKGEELSGSTRMRFAFAGRSFTDAMQARFPGTQAIVRSFLTEAELRIAWTALAAELQRSGARALGGAIMSHATSFQKSNPTGANYGIETKAGPTGDATDDGTLRSAEIAGMDRLPWDPRGFLLLCGCNSGSATGDGGARLADVFARRQGVVTVGQSGYAKFSKAWDRLDPHDGQDSSSNCFLWAYGEGLNNRGGDGLRMPGYVARLASGG